MNEELPTIRQRFFRIIGRAGLLATLLASLGIIGAGLMEMRYKLIEDFEQIATGVVHAYITLNPQKNTELFTAYLGEFEEAPGLMRICVYGAENSLMTKWERPDTPGGCPRMMIGQGNDTSGMMTHVALPAEKNGHYRGMIYVEGSLSGLKVWLVRGGMLVLVLLAVCWGTCYLAALWSAQTIMWPLLAIHKQVECLKSPDISICQLPTEGGTAETKMLSDDILALRNYMNELMVPREELLNAKRWHREVLGGMLRGLQHRLSADSPLLEHMNDYALLMQAERSDTPQQTRTFDLALILNESLTMARRLHRPTAQVNLTASLQAGLPQQCLGQPELLEGLLRHLLLIGLKRTRTGFICLRLCAPDLSTDRLHIVFEDSGPALQSWQLRQWLAPAGEETPPVFMDEDISWLLVARLIRRLRGNITGASREAGGLSLEASIPLAFAECLPEDKPTARPAPPVHHAPPLVLVVEGTMSTRARLAPLLDAPQYRTFTVRTHAQMVEWCCVLPFSAIVLNFTFPDGSEDALRKLTHMRETGTLQDIPFWAIADIDSQVGLREVTEQSVAGLLMLPLRSEQLQRFRTDLQPVVADFYLAHDTHLRRDFSSAINKSLSHMNAMLASQIAGLLPLIATRESSEKALQYEVHGVKSAALSLGYFRLAALMGQIEHALEQQGSITPHDWSIVTQALCDSGFAENAAEEDQNPTQRGTVPL